LLVAYGTAEAHHAESLGLFEQKVRRNFPETCVRRAFTSPRVRKQLTASGKSADSVHEALARLRLENFTHITVQSLHLIPGREYRRMLEEIGLAAQRDVQGALKGDISVGSPLLNSEEDIEQAAGALLQSLPAERAGSDIALWIGHGSGHAGKNFYALLQQSAQKLDKNILIGTLEEGLEQILPEIQKRAAKKIWLLPLLSVAGKHSREDMAGTHDASWRSRLELNNCRCLPVARGLIEYPAFTDLWIRHLREARLTAHQGVRA
jgi:sirohydrochlorin cobaltochelatase